MTTDLHAGPWAAIAASVGGVIATGDLPLDGLIDIAARGGPIALLAGALWWLERRCASDIKALRNEVRDVRVAGERSHADCRDELEVVTTRLLGMISK